MFDEWRHRWFPELQHIDQPRGRRKFYYRAIAHLFDRRGVGRFSFLAWGIMLAEGVGFLILCDWLSEKFGFPGSGWVVYFLLLLPSVFVYSVIIEMALVPLGHRHATAFLRKDMSQNGWPTCLACGYDLWGQTEEDRQRKCPECGQVWFRPERKRREPGTSAPPTPSIRKEAPPP